MIYQHRIWILRQHLIEQRLNKIHQMVNLLKLAAAILIELAIHRENVQRFEQRDRLVWFDFGDWFHMAILKQNLFNRW